MVATTKQVLEIYALLVKENNRLNRWKSEAIVVLGDWEEVWEAAGRPGPLGRSKAKNVLDEIKRLKELE